MDDHTDKTYQGAGFSGERMGTAPTAAPPPPDRADPPADDAPPPQWPASTIPEDRRWDYVDPAEGQATGHIIQGFLLGLFFTIFGFVAIALFSAPEKRRSRYLGAAIGTVLAWVAVTAGILATA